LLVLHEPEERLLGLLLAFEELAVEGSCLFGESLQGDQVFLRVREGLPQAVIRAIDRWRGPGRNP
jgi:hypothetical protein